MRREASISTLAAALLAALGIAPLASQAATIIVTTSSDSATDPGCTLRNAIVSMNTGTTVGNCANTGALFGTNDTINFDTAVAAFPNGGANTILLGNGQLSITAYHLTIDASANGNVTIDAQQNSRVMYDNAAYGSSLTLNHLTLRNGTASNDCLGNSIGGGICIPNASLALTDSTLSNNSASYGGGGIFSITGGITLTDSALVNNTTAGKGGGVFSTFHTGSVTLTNSTLSGNSALSGGGIYSGASAVTLTNSTLSGNSATNGKGGGIYSAAGTATLTNSTLSANSAPNGKGGGIFSGGTLMLTGSTLNGNSAANGDGGAIYSSGTGNATVINSTLSGNSAANGGGIYAYHPGYLTLTHATISANTATSFGGGGVRGNASITVNNSIVAGNTQAGGPDLYPGFGAGANNLMGGDPLLGALGDNGGPTQTMALETASAAFHLAAACVSTDQRGLARPANHCDAGAFEDTVFFNGFEGY